MKQLSFSHLQGKPASNGAGFLHSCSNPRARKKFLELFAGSSRLAATLANQGFPSESYEILRAEAENVFRPDVSKRIFALMSQKQLAAVWIGISCASFTRARRAPPNSRMPKPLRGDSPNEIYGLPDLCPKDEARVTLGNRQVRWAARVIRACIKHEIPVIVENPSSSRIWLVPEIVRLLPFSCCNLVTHQCMFGATHNKPTRLVSWGMDVSCMLRKCSCKHGICDRTGLRHKVLTGKENGHF